MFVFVFMLAPALTLAPATLVLTPAALALAPDRFRVRLRLLGDLTATRRPGVVVVSRAAPPTGPAPCRGWRPT